MSRMLSVAREDGKTDAFTYYLDGELWTAQYGASNRSVTAMSTLETDMSHRKARTPATGRKRKSTRA
jgi:hypothetical protein